MTMNAWISGPNARRPSLKARPAPQPGPDEVLVRIRAVALNNADLAPTTAEHVPGYDFTGEIAAVGQGGDANLIGSPVMGIAPGALADLVVAHRSHVTPLPKGLTFADAAALPTALCTEYGALRRAGLQQGDVVLITAATSGIGLVGLQIAKVLGAETVIGTTRTEEHRALLSRVGADHVIVSGAQGLFDAISSVTAGRGADIVLDHAAGPMLAAAIASTATGGSVVSVGRLAGPSAEVDLFALARSSASLRAVSFGFTPPTVLGDLFDGVRTDLLDAIVNGRIRAVVGATFPFTQVPAAFDRLDEGAEGKVVLVHE